MTLRADFGADLTDDSGVDLVADMGIDLGCFHEAHNYQISRTVTKFK